MRVLFDTNTVLDLLLEREPFVAASEEVLSRVEIGELQGYLCATTITTLHYMASKAIGAAKALLEIRKLLALFEIAPVNRPVLENALDLGFPDYEDAVLHEAARQVLAEAIVTRNARDFKRAELSVYSPEELNRILDLRTANAE